MTRKFSTRAIHDGECPNRATGAHNTPIYHRATISFDKAEDMAEAVLPDVCGGIVSFRIKGGAAEMNRFADSHELFGKGVSLGDVFTLVYPQPWRDNLIRLSAGCEDSDDIIREFELALEHA